LDKHRIKKLLDKFASGNISAKEQSLLKEWMFNVSLDEYNEILDDYKEVIIAHSSDEKVDPQLFVKIEKTIDTYEEKRTSSRKHRFYWASSAAAIFLLFFIGGLYYLNRDIIPEKALSDNKQVIEPGGNKAILTLSDGTHIPLDTIEEGEIAEQSGIAIVKRGEGQLVYGTINSALNDPDLLLSYTGSQSYNTITTPRGGQYQVVLPDGTKVWLNAASSLRFPTLFNTKERLVELQGEAYFEVTKNKKMPFRVITKTQQVEVLGTSFNISSYEDEAITKTSVLEGSVKVNQLSSNASHRVKSEILKSGQQSVLEGETMKVFSVNIQESLAWKNNKFMFANENIESVMRKVARWYDVEIVYRDNVSNKAIWGSISRFEDISEIINLLELTGSVHFKIEGRRIYVMK